MVYSQRFVDVAVVVNVASGVELTPLLPVAPTLRFQHIFRKLAFLHKFVVPAGTVRPREAVRLLSSRLVLSAADFGCSCNELGFSLFCTNAPVRTIEVSTSIWDYVRK